jgi:hypothetical protein
MMVDCALGDRTGFTASTSDGLAKQTVATIAQHRLPAIYPDRVYAVNGGLVSYGADRADLYRGAATYVDLGSGSCPSAPSGEHGR